MSSASPALGEVRYLDLPPNRIAYRVLGQGPPLLLVHGYPLSGLTFRHVAPELMNTFTCYIPDLPGAGETEWTDETDFGFVAQAQTLKAFAEELSLESYGVLAHDTGGTLARQLALIDHDRVTSLLLIGTEIPGHRPPLIPLMQKISNPNQTFMFKRLMRSKRFLGSKAAFGGCFYDRELIFGEFYETHIEPVLSSDRKISGLTHYLRGIDWELLDSFKAGHRNITAPTLLVWGEDDPIFPVAEARPMASQLGNCKGFLTVPRTRLFVHEEKPQEITRLALDFFTEHGRAEPALRP